MIKNNNSDSPVRYFLFFCLLGILMNISISSFAQDDGGSSTNSQLSFGVKLGSVVSTFTYEQPHNNIVLGLEGGAFMSYIFTENIGLQIEALYRQTGGRLLYFDAPWLIGKNYWYNISAENQKFLIHNVSVPILFKYLLPLGDVNAALLLGPDISYAIGAQVIKEATVFTESGSFHTYTETENAYSKIEKVHIAATAGIGMEVPFANQVLLINARYIFGITPVYKSYSYIGIPQITGDLSVHAVSLAVGLSF